MSRFVFLLVIAMIACVPQVNLAQDTPPPCSRGIKNDDISRIFSTNNLAGVYNKTSHILQIIVKENIDNIEIIIYKNGIVREYDADQEIQNGDFKNYLLNNYGSGEYTIYIKINNDTEIIRSFKW